MIINYIEDNEVLPLAMTIVRRSRKSLDLTMIMKEEIENTSEKYLSLLRSKINQKMVVRRIGFGSQKEFKEASDQLKIAKMPKNFQFKRRGAKFAQRMLISDKKEMLFAVYTGNKRFVFYTKYLPILNGFLQYFNNLFV